MKINDLFQEYFLQQRPNLKNLFKFLLRNFCCLRFEWSNNKCFVPRNKDTLKHKRDY